VRRVRLLLTTLLPRRQVAVSYLAFESFGGLAPAAISILRDLEAYARESLGSLDYRTSLSSLAVLLQKGNAEMLAQGVLMVSRSALQ